MKREDCTAWTDEQLVLQVLKDKEYYLCLLERYEKRMFHYLRASVRLEQEEYEDILQNAFLKAYLNLNDFDAKLKFSSWMYRIVHNEMIDHIRKNKTRRLTISLDHPQGEDFQLSDILADEKEDIVAKMDQQLLRERLAEILDTLPAAYKEIVVLRYMEDRDYQEISDILKKPMGTVATLLNRAKGLLRQKAALLYSKDSEQ